jgi:glutamate carboxypeptidase
MKKLAAIVFLFTGMQASGQSGLSEKERMLTEEVEAQMNATIELLKRSVNINSGTFNEKGVREVGEVYRKELDQIGFQTVWIRMPDSLKRAGHLVAFKKGKKGKKLFLIGHLDTVFEPDMPFSPFTLLNDSTATGQGVNDMKGGNVMMIAALKALNALGLLEDVTITVYFTGDEENAGDPIEVSRGDFIERAKQHDVALAFETAHSLHSVTTARRGASGWILEVEGKQAHSSGIFGNNGFGAIYETARILNAFRENLSTQAYLTFNPGLIAGGSEMNYREEKQMATVSGKTNIISPKTVVIGDLRFLTEEQKESARDSMRSIVARNLPGTNAKIRFSDGIPSMPPTKGNAALASMVNAISEAMGTGSVIEGNPGARGAGDISYVARYLDCLDGLGASGKGAHAPGETIHLGEYPSLIKRTALLLYRLTE